MNRKVFFKNIGLLSSIPLISSVESFAGNISTKNNLVNVLCCNIRVALDEDEKKGFGWNSRKEACIQIIKSQHPDVIGFQEVLKVQFEDLKNGLKDYHGVNFDGPEMDAHKEGYHGIAKNPIFYSKKRFDLIAAGSYWLSETPLVAGSMSWGTARARNMSWVRLYDKISKKEFRFISLHLDHVNNEAKLAQINMVLEESAQYPADFPQILVGDFNAKESSKIIQKVLQSGWKDSFVEANGDLNPGATVHSFKGLDDPKKEQRNKIDFIFTKANIKSVSSKVIRDQYKGVLPSDHYFLSASLEIV